MLPATDVLWFDQRLRELTEEAPSARPFLCKGLPFGCEVFLVGINPGKSSPFWPHWNPQTGYDKPEWLKCYLAKHGRYSPTRKRIELLFEAVEPFRCVETNIFPFPSRRESELPASKRDSRVFEFLLEAIRPRVVFVHGRTAIKHLVTQTRVDLPLGKFTKVKYRGAVFDVIAGYHLSYQWSFVKVKNLARLLVERCAGIPVAGEVSQLGEG
jgi:hypothetical protein